MNQRVQRFAMVMLAVAGISAGMAVVVRAEGNRMGGTGLYLTHAAETLEPGAVRLGAYGQYVQYDLSEDPEDWDLAPQLAWSPVRNLELMAAVPLRYHEAPEGDEFGIGDGTVGLKYRLHPAFSALGYVSLPLGDEDRGLGTGSTGLGLAGILSLPIGAGLSADLNLGYQLSSSGMADDDFTFYGLGLSLPLGARTLLFGEVAGRTYSEGDSHDTLQFDLGVRHRFNDRLSLTAGGGRGLRGDYGPEDPRALVFAGVEFRFGGKPAPPPAPVAAAPPAAVPAAPPVAKESAPAPVKEAAPVAKEAAPAPPVKEAAPPPVAKEAAPPPPPMEVVPAPVKESAPAHTAEELAAARKRLSEVEILFEYDRTRLTPEGERALQQVAAELARYPELRFTIEGHADNRGTSSYNKVLGLRRAETVMRHLVKAGIAFERMKLATGGELKPKVPNKDARSRSLNRRAIFLPLP